MIWIPCWLLSHVTSELGVYLFIIACFVHICSQIPNPSMLSSSDFEMGDVQVIVISAGGGLIELNDISIPHGSAPQQQASQNGGDCGDDDDPQCMIRQVEVDEEVV